MKVRNMLPKLSLFATTIIVIVSDASHRLNAEADKLTTKNEDEQFWKRFLQNDLVSLSVQPLPPTSPTAKPFPAPILPPPTPNPNAPPTIAPIVPPTLAPTVLPCIVKAAIDCETLLGLPCDDIQSPSAECATDVGLLSLTFQYLDSTCAQSVNNQGSKAFCEDFETLTTPVTVKCITDRGSPLTVTPPTIAFGDFFTVSNPDGGNLLDQTDCTVINVNSVKVQQNVIDTSGDSPLNPGDKFGSFQLVTCGDTTCAETIQYTVDITNVGPVPFDVLSVDFTFQDQIPNLLGEVSNQVQPGQTATIKTEQLEINICSGDEYIARVIVEADPGQATTCTSEAEFIFTSPSFEVVTRPPVAPISSAPVAQPVAPPVVAPVVAPVEPPVEPPVVAPVVAPVAAPVEIPVAAPVEIPVVAPVVAPVESPVVAPVAAPVVAPVISAPVLSPIPGLCVIEVDVTCRINGTIPCNNPGNLAGVVPLEYSMDVIIPNNLNEDGVNLTSFVALTSFAGNLDLSAQVAGQFLVPGSSIRVSIPGTVDLSIQRRYTVLATVEGTAIPSGVVCNGTDFDSFFVGEPPSPSVPVAMPVRAPVSSVQPTEDATGKVCILGAEIDCITVINGRSCNNLEDPRGVSCRGGSLPSALSFLYRGNKCPPAFDVFNCTDVSSAPLPDRVFITVSGDAISNAYIVNLNELFVAESTFVDGLFIEISTVANNAAGTLLQTIEMNINCNDGSLVLGKTIGAVEVVGFVNAAGSFTSVFLVELTYTVTVGPYGTLLSSAAVNSDFQPEPFEALTAPQRQSPGSSLVVFTETTNVDVIQKFDESLVFNFILSAAGTTIASSGFSCTAEVTYTF